MEDQPHAPVGRPGLFRTLAFILQHPFKFFESENDLPTRVRPLVFAVFCYACGIGGVTLYSMPRGLRGGTLILAMLAGAVAGAAVAPIQLFVAAGIAHITARVLGGAAPYRRTFTALSYASAPAVFQILPFGGVVAMPWILFLGGIGLKRFQRISTARAAVAVSMPVVLPVAFLVGFFGFWVQLLRVPSGSMEPTVHQGDVLVSKRKAYGRFSGGAPRRGDVVILKRPDSSRGADEHYVKRVVGLPGDVVTVSEGHLALGGVPVPSCRVGTTTLPDGTEGELFVEFLDGLPYFVFFEAAQFTRHEGPFRVAEGEIFVMGDNRNNSLDSRTWFGGRGGGVPLANITGRASSVLMPIERFGKRMEIPTLEANAPPELRSKFAECLAGRTEGSL